MKSIKTKGKSKSARTNFSSSLFTFKNTVDKSKKLRYTNNTFKLVIRSRGQGEPVNEESPSYVRTECRRNPGGGDFKESATERKPPIANAIGKAERVR